MDNRLSKLIDIEQVPSGGRWMDLNYSSSRKERSKNFCCSDNLHDFVEFTSSSSPGS